MSLKRTLLVVGLTVGFGFAQASAQSYSASSDQAILETTLQDVQRTVEEVLGWVGKQVGEATGFMQGYMSELDQAAGLEEIEDVLDGVQVRVHTLKQEAEDRNETLRARKLADVERRLDELIEEIQEIERGEYSTPPESVVQVDTDRDERMEVREHRRSYGRPGYNAGYDQFDFDADFFSPHILTLFGAEPFYPTLPGLRYNRVEGLVLGLDIPPITLTSSRMSRIYGQAGYAFGLDDIRYQIGFETQVGRSWTSRKRYALKLGAAYHENTATDDTWKIGPIENALASFFFRNDFYDYYETEGWTFYVNRYIEQVDGSIRVGYQIHDYRSLSRNTNWSLFGSGSFRSNPAIDDGRLNSILVQAEAGEVYSFGHAPRGAAMRAVAEFGQGLGGDFSFNRYLLDGRLYRPLNRDVTLSLRGRWGHATDRAPLQKQFTLGGVGTVRAYPQNVFIGNRLLLGNAELTLDDVGLGDYILDDLQLLAFIDAGWVGDAYTQFESDTIIGAAGFGIALDDRRIRLEIAWPLADENQSSPAFWFRLNPTF